MKKNLIYIIPGVIALLLVGILLFKNNKPDTPKIVIGDNIDFDYKMIKSVHNHANNKNYMISPLSIAYALSILKEGASDNTKTEIEKVLNNYKLPNVVNIKDRISLANALFIKNEFPINDEFVDLVRKNYNSEILYDEFKSPDIINNWVNEKTYKMIPKIVDKLDPDFRVGIANAIAIDVEWDDKFKCDSTRKEEFTLQNKKKLDVAMMHSSNDISYFEIKGAKGIIKDYRKYNPETGEVDYDNGTRLEYIAILPDNIDDFISNFDTTTINNIKDNLRNPSDRLEINLSLPKYTYDYSYDDFGKDLINLGIKEAFDKDNAKFKNISDKQLYVSDAIHKSHIELSENGTKAAAVTAFMMAEATAYREPIQKEIINIKFDKPFVYLIKDKATDNIWFFGTVYEPMKYSEHKCETSNKWR